MTPSPEQVGTGIENLELEKQLSTTKAEINSIFEKAISKASEKGKATLVGVIGENELLPTGETIKYVHPVVEIKSNRRNLLELGNDSGDIVALGGENFAKLFPLSINIMKSTALVKWGEQAEKKEYSIIIEEELNDFGLLIDTHSSNYQYLDLIPIYLGIEEEKNEGEEEINSIEKGKVADYLLPNTIDPKVKLDVAKKILSGLKNASSVAKEK